MTAQQAKKPILGRVTLAAVIVAPIAGGALLSYLTVTGLHTILNNASGYVLFI